MLVDVDLAVRLAVGGSLFSSWEMYLGRPVGDRRGGCDLGTRRNGLRMMLWW